jgi:subtilisin family serine protease
VTRLLLLAALAALALPGAAPAARFAVGVAPGAKESALRGALAARGLGRGESLGPLHAVVVDAPAAAALRGLPGGTYVERLGARRPAFVPNDPLLAKQWYVAQNRAYDAWDSLPQLLAVPVALIDSGVDASHPDLAPRIADAKSFVGGSARVDRQGHGTFVAGLIAAEVDNGIGIAGLSPSAELLVAKVVTSDRTIPVEAEAKAIHWAVAAGAKVINMSLGGVRDPLDPSDDSYSPLEAAAIAYAVKKNVVVVAAVGNADQAPSTPWRFASYPAALPHVLGVSALARNGASPSFSNRDAVYNDIAAPGEDIVSTLPRQLTASYKDCAEQGYSLCGPDEYRHAEGTSFAAPQVSAAAATLLAVRPGLRADQVVWLLERYAVDANAATGCKTCPARRDRFTGWGRLDIAAALQGLDGPLATRDRYEPNDEAGGRAVRIFGKQRRLEATLDYWDDQQDVYAVRLKRGQRMYAGIAGPPRTDVNLVLWRPGTTAVDDFRNQRRRVTQSTKPGSREYLAHRAKRAGLYYLQVKIASAGSGRYRLRIVKT